MPGTTNNPVQLDHYQRLVEVHWGGGAQALLIIETPDIAGCSLSLDEVDTAPLYVIERQRVVSNIYDDSYWGGPHSWLIVEDPLHPGTFIVPPNPNDRIPIGGEVDWHQVPDWPFGDGGHPGPPGVSNPYYPTIGPQWFVDYNAFYDWWTGTKIPGENGRTVSVTANSLVYNAGPSSIWDGWVFTHEQQHIIQRGDRIRRVIEWDFRGADARDKVDIDINSAGPPDAGSHTSNYSGQTIVLTLQIYGPGVTFTVTSDNITASASPRSTQTRTFSYSSTHHLVFNRTGFI